MENLEHWIKVGILACFLFFFFKASIKGYLLEATIIVTFYSTIASIIGQESYKSLVLFLLYGIILLLNLKIKRRIKSNNGNEFYKISIVFFFLILIVSVIGSPASGYDYFNSKLALTIVEILIPVLLLITIKFKNFEIKILFRFFEVLSVLVACLMILLAYREGIQHILESEYMVRISSGESNVIWTGRFLSIGFFFFLIRKKNIIIKSIALISILIAMILTGSKSILLFTFIGVFLYFILLSTDTKSKVQTFLLLSGTLIAFYFLISLLNPSAVEKRFSTQSGTISDREGKIEEVFKDYIDSSDLFFGKGFATTGYPIEGNYSQRNYPHNITVEILYELGFIGLIFYFTISFFPIWIFKRGKIILPQNLNILIGIQLIFIFYAQTSGDLYGNPLPFILGAYLMRNTNFCDQELNHCVKYY